MANKTGLAGWLGLHSRNKPTAVRCVTCDPDPASYCASTPS
jgi:hypothetical protein